MEKHLSRPAARVAEEAANVTLCFRQAAELAFSLLLIPDVDRFTSGYCQTRNTQRPYPSRSQQTL